MPVSPEPRTCGVVGSPIEHSLSPVLHKAAYRHLGLAWQYTRNEVREGELTGFVAGLDDSWRGLSVTMPLKREALELATWVSPTAELAGAANTLLFEPDGMAHADNTDIDGMVECVRAVPTAGGQGGNIRSACVWGGGSTAAGAMVALVRMDVTEVHLHVRSESRAQAPVDAASRVGADVQVQGWEVGAACASAGLVMLTAPAGAADSVASELAALAREGKVLFDVVYDPWPTAAADAWQRAGGGVTSGLDLLVHQAAGQIRLMTGRDVPTDVLYAALPRRAR